MKNQKKVIYEVLENETINDCLDRIKKDGFIPIKRTEKPIFHEVKEENGTKYEPSGRQIQFEVKKQN